MPRLCPLPPSPSGIPCPRPKEEENGGEAGGGPGGGVRRQPAKHLGGERGKKKGEKGHREGDGER